MSTTIESLELEILSSSQSAESGLDKLTASLSKLKTVTKGGLGLTAVAKQIHSVKDTTNGISTENVSNVNGLAKAIQLLNGTKISPTVAKQITAISTALSGADFSGSNEKLRGLAESLEPLSNLPKNNLTSYVNSIKKLPEALDKLDTRTLYTKIQSLTRIMKPLADEMQKIANGFSVFPTRIQKLVNENDKLASSNKKVSLSYTDLYSKIRMAVTSVKTIATKIASAMKEMIGYYETVNLFSVSMGKYAVEAGKYAEKVSELMGIDPAEWMKFQGTIMTLATGFGIAGDRANTMSQQLTQLAYDISSFREIGVEEAMQKIQSGFAGELEPLRAIGYDLSQAKLEAIALSLGIDKSVSSMTQAEKAQLRYYAIMTQVTVAQGDMARTLESPANQLRIFKAQINQAARAIGSIFIPALNAILPYAIAVAKVIRAIASTIASAFGFEMPEVDYSGVDVVTNSATDASEALDKATESAKKLKSYMLGFDELNVINPNDGSGGGSGSVGGSDVGFDFELPTYDFIGDAINTKVDEITKMITDSLAEIEAIVSGFSLAIGTLLVVTGANVPLGLGLIALGAVGLVHSIVANWDTMSDELARVLTKVTSIVGGFSLAIGAFLAFTGVNVGLGAALMVLGAVSLATAATINWKFLEGDFGNTLSILTGIVSGALLAMGALFAFTGVSVPLGIALMAAGAVGLVTSFALDWDSLSDPMRNAITALESVVGGGLLAIGAVLAFTGVNIPLGIGLIAAGAVSLASAVVLNWESMNGDLEETIKTITTIVSGALLGIGAILAFTGVNMPLGIAMIAAGAVGIVASIPVDWDSVKNELEPVLKELSGIVGAALLAVGAILAFSGVALPLGIALMAAGAVSLGTAVALNWDSIVTAMQGTFGAILAIIGASAMVIGLILLFTGVGTALGLGLLLGGATALGTAVAFNWDSIVTAIEDTWAKIEEFWDTYIAPIFTKEWWEDLGKDCMDGLKSGLDSIKDKVQTWVDDFVAKVKDFLGIHSPSTVFAEIGGFLIEGLFEGMLDWLDDIKTWCQEHIVEPFNKAMDSVLEFSVDVKNTATEWWDNVKKWWKDKVGTADKFKTDVKDDSQTWWDDVKRWWSRKVVHVTDFQTDVRDDSESWWVTVKNWWSRKVGSVSNFTTDVKDDSESWWTRVRLWWGNKVGSVDNFETDVKDDSQTWWDDVKKWWKIKVGYVTNFNTNPQDDSTNWWTKVKTWWKDKVGTADKFKTDVEDNSNSWWTKVFFWWNDKVGSVSNFTTDVKDDSVSWWSKVFNWWKNKVGTVDKFITDVKDDSTTWWDNVKKWWKNKVGSADKFKTDVEDNSTSWWTKVWLWWNDKVDSVTKFKTDVEDNSNSWWTKVWLWWKDKVGTVDKFKTDVKDDSTTWWDNVKKWWKNKVGTADKFKTDVKDDSTTWWNNVKKWWKDKVGTADKFKTDVKDDSTTWWNNVKKWWSVDSKNGVDVTVNAKKGWVSTLKSALGIPDSFSLSFKLPKIKIEWNKTEVAGFEIKYPVRFYTEYAQGGFPDTGQMFIAREAGPELVGTIGNRNAVVNNDQIVESVSAGVYQAVVAALGSGSNEDGDTRIVINLDGEKIYENQQKIARNRGYDLGMGAFSFG